MSSFFSFFSVSQSSYINQTYSKLIQTIKPNLAKPNQTQINFKQNKSAAQILYGPILVSSETHQI